MYEYADVVSILGEDGKKYLRTAPKWSDIKEGDEVMFQVEADPNEIKGKVIDAATFRTNDEEFRVLKTFVKDLVLKVTKVIVYKEFTYAEEEGGEANG